MTTLMGILKAPDEMGDKFKETLKFSKFYEIPFHSDVPQEKKERL